MTGPRIYPVGMIWREVDVVEADGEVQRRWAMVPLKRYDNLAKRQYLAGSEYPLVPLEARSRASHSHYFAAINEGYKNLPEKIAARWPTSEHFRKWCLVETGWFHESEIECANEKLARQTAVLMRSFDGYARISVHGPKVIIRRPRSQSAAAMSRPEFEASKKDVLELAEHMIAVPKGSLRKEAERIA